VTKRREGWRGWDDYAAFYDWENAQTVQRRDIAFWERLALPAEGPVLELGCGTGRITLPIARGGTRIVGIDRSGPMLARASRKLRRARLGARASLLRGDIRHLPFRRACFPLVVAPYGILQSLTRERDLAATLESVARVLRAGGLFGIDLVPDLPRWSEYDARRTLSGRMGRSTKVSLIESVTQDRARGLTMFDQRYVTIRDGVRRQHDFTLMFRTLSIRQMTRRLERAGFGIDAVLGDYRGGPWDDRADVWVILARRR
jgi:ubiquinone/menaquinone biosynthesis C-methylase UbiE